jgi:hypothetical protein
MKTIRETVELVVAGGGTAGHIAAIQAARVGVKTSVIEAGSMLGGTMTAGGVYTPAYFFSARRPVVLGIPWELYKKSKDVEGLPPLDFRKRRPQATPGAYGQINIPIYVAVAEEESLKAGVILHYHEFISEIIAVGNTWEITSLGRGIKRLTTAKEIIDCSGDADAVRILGLGVLTSEDRQPATYEYKIEGLDYEQLSELEKEVQLLYEEAMENGALQKGDFAYPNMLPFKYYLDQGGHNATHVYCSDTSTAEGQTLANVEGRARMLRMFKFVTSTIPGGERAVLKMMSAHAVARETFRILGETVVTQQDFMQATDFPDKVCNAFNYVDMHSEQTGCEVQFLDHEALLPKIPMGALIPKGSSRITAAGRIVSADRVAFAGVRAQCTCMAMGQAMGAAAALAVQRAVASREVPSQDVVALTVEHGAVPL